MKNEYFVIVFSFFVVSTFGFSTEAFADHPTAEVSVPAGTSTPGCQDTNECFLPPTVIVDVGGEVTWSNDDTAAHTVTSGTAGDGPDGVFDSGLFMAGSTYSKTFSETGDYSYFCIVHPWMIGIVTVQDASAEEEIEEETHEETHEEEIVMEVEESVSEVFIEFDTPETGAEEMMVIDIKFTDFDGNLVEHVNYEIIAEQGGRIVLYDKNAHSMTGMASHTTGPLFYATSDDKPVNIEVELLGLGTSEPYTGPTGKVFKKQVVPEFGTLTMIILGVSIVSIIAFSARSKILVTP